MREPAFKNDMYYKYIIKKFNLNLCAGTIKVFTTIFIVRTKQCGGFPN